MNEKKQGKKNYHVIVTKNGFLSKTRVEDYRLLNKGCRGVIGIKTNDRNGLVVSTCLANSDDYLFITTKKGICAKIPLEDIHHTGRSSQGIRIMNLDDEDELVSVCAEKNSLKIGVKNDRR